jgi:membrane fusion protein (multidrug efflux system)
MNRKRTLWITILVIAACIGIFYHFYHKDSGKAEKTAGTGMPPTPVHTAAVKIQNWQTQFQATGTLNAESGVMLKAETTGRVTKIFFESGQKVKAGDPLLEINPSILKAQLNAAKAQGALSKGSYERALKLYERKVISKQDLETAQANNASDQAKAEQIQAELSQNLVHAPINGKLGLRLFNLGDYVKQGQDLINLQSTDILRVDFAIPGNKIHALSIGDKVTIQTDAYPDKQFTGKVTAIDSAIDPATRTVSVRAEVPNTEGKLFPGNFAQVTLYVGKGQPLVTIPQTAIVYAAENNYVYVVQKNHAVKKNIDIAEQSKTEAGLKSGLQAGDVVVTEGQLKIGDGAPVNAIH